MFLRVLFSPLIPDTKNFNHELISPSEKISNLLKQSRLTKLLAGLILTSTKDLYQKLLQHIIGWDLVNASH